MIFHTVYSNKTKLLDPRWMDIVVNDGVVGMDIKAGITPESAAAALTGRFKVAITGDHVYVIGIKSGQVDLSHIRNAYDKMVDRVYETLLKLPEYADAARTRAMAGASAILLRGRGGTYASHVLLTTYMHKGNKDRIDKIKATFAAALTTLQLAPLIPAMTKKVGGNTDWSLMSTKQRHLTMILPLDETMTTPPGSAVVVVRKGVNSEINVQTSIMVQYASNEIAAAVASYVTVMVVRGIPAHCIGAGVAIVQDYIDTVLDAPAVAVAARVVHFRAKATAVDGFNITEYVVEIILKNGTLSDEWFPKMTNRAGVRKGYHTPITHRGWRLELAPSVAEILYMGSCGHITSA